MKVRLQKILSTAGIASRRAAERLLTDGRVSVNGQTITQLGTRADPDQDDIRIDGRRIKTVPRRIYLLLNKPRGYMTTRADPQGRPTVLDLMPRLREYVYPVGRLDYDSEGLLLLTNDGDLAARLMHPRHEIERTYVARVRGVPDDIALKRLARGIVIDGHRTSPAKVRRLAPSTLAITIHEGRSRQVRKMSEAIGHPVIRLERVRFGPIEDSSLKPGSYRELSAREVALLKRAVGLGEKG
jgi:23S rRNA pseudouridine2605 synthase